MASDRSRALRQHAPEAQHRPHLRMAAVSHINPHSLRQSSRLRARPVSPDRRTRRACSHAPGSTWLCRGRVHALERSCPPCPVGASASCSAYDCGRTAAASELRPVPVPEDEPRFRNRWGHLGSPGPAATADLHKRIRLRDAGARRAMSSTRSAARSSCGTAWRGELRPGGRRGVRLARVRDLVASVPAVVIRPGRRWRWAIGITDAGAFLVKSMFARRPDDTRR